MCPLGTKENQMKHTDICQNAAGQRHKIVYLAAGMFLLLCTICSYSYAEPPVKNWELVVEIDGRIWASQMVWNKTTTRPAKPYINAPRAEMAALAKAKQNGLDEVKTKEFVEKVSQHSEQISRGYVRHHTFRFWRSGSAVRCDVLNEDRIITAVDYFDGKNTVTLETFRGQPKPGVLPISGKLVRDTKETMPHSASRFGDLLFFAAGRITDMFPMSETILREGDGNTIILERPYNAVGIPKLMRLQISKQTKRPIQLDWLNQFNNRPILRFRASEFRAFPADVTFHSQVIVEAFNSKGEVTRTENYNLTKGSFNKAADLTDLKVPPGTEIGDLRFGQELTVSYTVGPKGILPSDNRVREMLKEQRGIDGIKNDTQPKTSGTQEKTPLGVFCLGMLCILMGVMLWNKSKPND